MTLSIMKLCHYAECHCAECRDLFVGMLNVIMLIVIRLNVVMLNVIMLNVVASIHGIWVDGNFHFLESFDKKYFTLKWFSQIKKNTLIHSYWQWLCIFLWYLFYVHKHTFGGGLTPSIRTVGSLLRRPEKYFDFRNFIYLQTYFWSSNSSKC